MRLQKWAGEGKKGDEDNLGSGKFGKVVGGNFGHRTLKRLQIKLQVFTKHPSS